MDTTEEVDQIIQGTILSLSLKEQIANNQDNFQGLALWNNDVLKMQPVSQPFRGRYHD